MRKQQRERCITTAFGAVLGLLGLAACTQADAGTQCDSKACFEQQFADCEPARYASTEMAGAQVRYRIDGPVDDDCKVTFRFSKHPKPDWVDKPLHMALDSEKPFGPQAQDAVGQCLGNDLPMDYQCSGPLRGARAWRIAREGDGPVPEAEAADVARARAAKTQAATAARRPCGQTVETSGEPLYPLPRNGRWGYVNRAGDWVIEPQWSQAEPFSEGRAAVSKGDNQGTSWGVIDRSGRYVVELSIPSEYANGPRVPRSPIKPFSGGCAAVQPGVSPGNNHPTPYFITRDGRFWLRAGLPEALAGRKVKEFGSFSQGLAWFRIFDIDSSKEYGYIDAQGQVAIDVGYALAGNFAGGLAPAQIKNNLWGYIDPDGELAWPGKWSLDHAQDFSNGLAAITTRDDRTAYFDGDEIVIEKLHFDPPRTLKVRSGDKTYEDTPIDGGGAFANGLAPVTLPDWPHPLVYMDIHGKAVLAPGADLGTSVCNGNRRPQFRHGLAQLRVANKDGECDRPKKIANGRFETHAQSHIVYIDTDGEIVLEGEGPLRESDTEKSSFDLEEEVVGVVIAESAAFDDLNAIVHAFEHTGVESITGTGDDVGAVTRPSPATRRTGVSPRVSGLRRSRALAGYPHRPPPWHTAVPYTGRTRPS